MDFIKTSSWYFKRVLRGFIESFSITACQAALVQSPAAYLAALANHRAAIDPAFAKTLAIVGDYACEPHVTVCLSVCLCSVTTPLWAPGADSGQREKTKSGAKFGPKSDCSERPWGRRVVTLVSESCILVDNTCPSASV